MFRTLQSKIKLIRKPRRDAKTICEGVILHCKRDFNTFFLVWGANFTRRRSPSPAEIFFKKQTEIFGMGVYVDIDIGKMLQMLRSPTALLFALLALSLHERGNLRNGEMNKCLVIINLGSL